MAAAAPSQPGSGSALEDHGWAGTMILTNPAQHSGAAGLLILAAHHCILHPTTVPNSTAQGAGMVGHAARCAGHAAKSCPLCLGTRCTAEAHSSLLPASGPPAAPSTVAATLPALGTPTGTARAGRVNCSPAAPAPASTPGTYAKYHTGAPQHATHGHGLPCVLSVDGCTWVMDTCCQGASSSFPSYWKCLRRPGKQFCRGIILIAACLPTRPVLGRGKRSSDMPPASPPAHVHPGPVLRRRGQDENSSSSGEATSRYLFSCPRSARHLQHPQHPLNQHHHPRLLRLLYPSSLPAPGGDALKGS